MKQDLQKRLSVVRSSLARLPSTTHVSLFLGPGTPYQVTPKNLRQAQFLIAFSDSKVTDFFESIADDNCGFCSQVRTEELRFTFTTRRSAEAFCHEIESLRAENLTVSLYSK